jgi:hypothetical protein
MLNADSIKFLSGLYKLQQAAARSHTIICLMHADSIRHLALGAVRYEEGTDEIAGHGTPRLAYK